MHKRFGTFAALALAMFFMAWGAQSVCAQQSSQVLVQLAEAYEKKDTNALVQLAAQFRTSTPDALGLGPADYVATLSELAETLRAKGKLAEAAALYEKAIATIEQTSGKDAFELLGPLDGLAKVKTEAGQTGEAIALQERALSVAARTLGALHPNLAPRYSALIAAIEKRGDKAKAEQLKAARSQIAQIEETTKGSKGGDFGTLGGSTHGGRSGSGTCKPPTRKGLLRHAPQPEKGDRD